MAPSKKKKKLQPDKQVSLASLDGMPSKAKRHNLAQLSATMTHLNDTQIQFLQRAMLDVQLQELTDQLGTAKREAATANLTFTKQLADHELVIEDLKSDVRRYETYIESLANDKAAAENKDSDAKLTLLKANAKLNSELSAAHDRIAELKSQCKSYESQLESLLANQLHHTNQIPPEDVAAPFGSHHTSTLSSHDSLIPPLLAALNQSPHTVEIQLDATTALFHLLKESRNVPLFLDWGGIDLVCDAMEHHPTQSQILLNGGHIFWKLTFSRRQNVRPVLVLVSALKRIALDAAKQYCWQLHHTLTQLMNDDDAAEPEHPTSDSSHNIFPDMVQLLLQLAQQSISSTPRLCLAALEAVHKVTKINPPSIDHLLSFFTSSLAALVVLPSLHLVVTRLVHMHVQVYGILELPEASRSLIDETLHAVEMSDEVAASPGLKGEVQGMIVTWQDHVGGGERGSASESEWPVLPSVHRHSLRRIDSLAQTTASRLIQLSQSLPEL
ncbi:hypothetical protein, variant [Aphanomyces astaci]|uniref:Uncharacterized protein n=1 Tax=Aphanomyces astaci TaxID=112090 RepID=W4G3V0_APHAT|nr:hypothetical protein, variant [Aphanomyces astaci]ETV73961.1 hypothetical protein, variant [Aphanomyces astaci]|eukprot:XP_009836473.1 hypothetical protein, variant [Aphanomyces astaci]